MEVGFEIGHGKHGKIMEKVMEVMEFPKPREYEPFIYFCMFCFIPQSRGVKLEFIFLKLFYLHCKYFYAHFIFMFLATFARGVFKFGFLLRKFA